MLMVLCWWFLASICSGVEYEGQGKSGQAIKLFQITSYVNDFQTLNNPGSWQSVVCIGASKN